MRRNLLLGNEDFGLFLTGESFNVFPKNHKNQNCQNQSQSKCSTTSINKFIELIYCHLFFLSKAIAKPRDIIVKSILQVNSKIDGAKKIDKNKAAEILTKNPEYTFWASLEITIPISILTD